MDNIQYEVHYHQSVATCTCTIYNIIVCTWCEGTISIHVYNYMLLHMGQVHQILLSNQRSWISKVSLVYATYAVPQSPRSKNGWSSGTVTVENCLFQCIGAVALPFPPSWDALSYLWQFWHLICCLLWVNRPWKGPKTSRPFLLLELCGTVAQTRETSETRTCWPRLE